MILYDDVIQMNNIYSTRSSMETLRFRRTSLKKKKEKKPDFKIRRILTENELEEVSYIL